MSSITSTATIQCLRSIFARFGLPEHVVTDNGPSFMSDGFKDFLLKNGISVSRKSCSDVKIWDEENEKGQCTDQVGSILIQLQNHTSEHNWCFSSRDANGKTTKVHLRLPQARS